MGPLLAVAELSVFDAETLLVFAVVELVDVAVVELLVLDVEAVLGVVVLVADD